MPNKSRRVASRQAEIASKKRRPPKKSRRYAENIEGNIDVAEAVTENDALIQASEPISSIRKPERVTPGIQNKTVNSNPYIWDELKRIGAITAVVSAVLILLTFIM